MMYFKNSINYVKLLWARILLNLMMNYGLSKKIGNKLVWKIKDE